MELEGGTNAEIEIDGVKTPLTKIMLERAKVVREILINDFKIDPKRIKLGIGEAGQQAPIRVTFQ